MLKLQRNSEQSKGITIRFRDDEPFVNRGFVRALFVALFLHLIGFSFISVDSMKIKPLPHYPPALTEIDMGVSSHSKSAATSLHVDEQGLLPRYVLQPEASIPSIPEMPDIDMKFFMENIRSRFSLGDVFFQLEKVPYVSYSGLLSFTEEKFFVKARVVGNLAHRVSSAENLEGFAYDFEKGYFEGRHIVKVEVRVDDRKGEIFWAAVRGSSHNEWIDQLALQAVSNVYFERTDASFVTEGEIEIIFNFPRRNSSIR